MLKFLDFMKRAPYVPCNKSQQEIDKEYKYWRLRIMYSMYMGYVVFYFTRKNLAFIMPSLVSEMHFSKEELGLMGSAFYIVYGLSKFLCGIWSDKSNPRYFMAIGLIASGVTNICFGFSSSITMLIFFWILNGFFQGWGWPPCGRLITRWYSQKERGRWWAIWNTSHNVGGGLIPIIAGLCATYMGWRSAMFIPGVIAIGVGIWLINRMRDVPESEGLPPIEEYKNDYPDETKVVEDDASMWEIINKYLLKNKYIWILTAAFTLVYIVRTAVNDWGALFLSEQGNSLLSSDSVVSFFELGGFFGSLVSGWASDKIFDGRRGPVNVIFCVGILVSVAAFWFTAHGGFSAHATCLFAIGFFIFGPQMLIAIAAVELSHREAAGTSTGFIGFFSYFGAALTGYPVGYIIHHAGWQGFFITMIICSLISVGLLSLLWSVKGRRKQKMTDLEKDLLEDKLSST